MKASSLAGGSQWILLPPARLKGRYPCESRECCNTTSQATNSSKGINSEYIRRLKASGSHAENHCDTLVDNYKSTAYKILLAMPGKDGFGEQLKQDMHAMLYFKRLYFVSESVVSPVSQADG